MGLIFTGVVVIMGTLIGVGFASGREIVTFFAQFGWCGIVLAVVASVIFGVVVYFEVVKTVNRSASTHRESSVNGYGEGLGNCNDGIIAGTNVTKLEKFFDGVMTVCCFVVMSAMMAGVFDLASGLFGVNYILPAVILIVCFVFVWLGFKSVEVVNRFFVPLVFLGIVAVGCVLAVRAAMMGDAGYLIVRLSRGAGVFDIVKAALMMLFYVGMNVLTIMPIVKVVSRKIKTKKAAIILATMFAGGVGMVLVFSSLVLVSFGDFAVSMPMLALAKKCGSFVGAAYSVLILMGLVTTLVSTALVIKEKIKLKIKDNLLSAMLCFLMGLVLSLCGFKYIIDYIYPLIGALGVFYILASLIIKTQKINKNNKNALKN